MGAFLEGWRRVLRAPALSAGVSAAVLVGGALMTAAHPAAPSESGTGYVLPGSGTAWGETLQLFYVQAGQLARMIAPDVARYLQPLDFPAEQVASLLLRCAGWLFLTGGILDRLARGRPVGSAAFFAAAGVYFFRFLRLTIITAIPGWALFRLLQMSSANLPAHLGILIVVMLAGIVIDFAQVRTVVEDRLSMVASLSAGFRFVRRRALRVLGLMLLNGLALLVVIRLGVQIAGTAGPGWLTTALWIALGIAAVLTKMAVMASQVVFFQGELAHAGYTAAPVPRWPDSPAVEALQQISNGGGDRLR